MEEQNRKKVKKAKKKGIVKLTIQESKRTVLELGDSIDPATPAGRSLKGLLPFLERMQQEVANELPLEVARDVRKTLAVQVANFFLTILLKPLGKLFQELWAKAVMVTSRILGGS